MLTADQLDALPGPIIDLYEKFLQSVINDIGRRLARLDYDSSTWQMQRLIESGAVYENALEQLAKMTGESESTLRGIFESAGVKALRFDDAIYKAAGLNPLPLNLSPAMAQVLAAGLRKTRGVMQNLTMTSAMSGQQAFLEASDLAYIQISSGALDYNSAIRSAVKQVAAQGLTVINYANGRHDQLDVAMRRAVLTGVNQTVGNLQIARADEMGCNLVQTSAHIGARNTGTGPANHESWQGKIYSRSGAGEYPNFIEVTGYGTGPGLCGWNCRHSFYPYFEGISENAYRQSELESYARKTVEYNGETLSVYEATQEQRAIERKIRFWKRQETALKAAGLDASGETEKVKAWQAEMRKLVRETGLLRHRERERVSYGPNLSQKASKVNFHSGEFQYVADLADVRGCYSPGDPGLPYAVTRPVFYNEFAARHLVSDPTHNARLPWVEKNCAGLFKAISSPNIIEKQLRARKDGYFSATHIAELFPDGKDEERFIVVAISLSKNPANGYHQVTTIHPARWRDIYKSNGELRDKYVQVK